MVELAVTDDCSRVEFLAGVLGDRMTNHIQGALDRAFPISQMGGLSGAMYPADEGEGQGWAISNEDWEVVSGVIRELIEDPVAAVRRGVESGTIKGEVREASWSHGGYGGFCVRATELGIYVVIGPVSDGGSET